MLDSAKTGAAEGLVARKGATPSATPFTVVISHSGSTLTRQMDGISETYTLDGKPRPIEREGWRGTVVAQWLGESISVKVSLADRDRTSTATSVYALEGDWLTITNETMVDRQSRRSKGYFRRSKERVILNQLVRMASTGLSVRIPAVPVMLAIEAHSRIKPAILP